MAVAETALELTIRLDIRAMREAAGVSQYAIAELFGWERDAVSKLEVGRVRVKLDDYIRIAKFCRDAIPGHPAVALAERYLPVQNRRK